MTDFTTLDPPTVVCAFYDRTLRGMKGWQHVERFRYFYADNTRPDSFLEVIATRISGLETRVELKQFEYDPHNPRLSDRDQCASS